MKWQESRLLYRCTCHKERCLQKNTTSYPGTGLSPMRWDQVIGTKAKRDFQPDELIEIVSQSLLRNWIAKWSLGC